MIWFNRVIELGTWVMFFVGSLYLAYVLSCVWL